MSLLPMRGTDKYGSGAYGASRGQRTHKGIDLACYPNTRITLSLIGIETVGKVTKIGLPYAEHPEYKYVQVTTPNDVDVRVFYVTPMVKVGEFIDADTVLGISQNLQIIYPGITSHTHIEIKKGTDFLDPKKYINGRLEKDLQLITV